MTGFVVPANLRPWSRLASLVAGSANGFTPLDHPESWDIVAVGYLPNPAPRAMRAKARHDAVSAAL